MPTTYPDFSHLSKYNPMAAFDKVVLADNVPTLASEDGEVQDVSSEKVRNLTRIFYGDGFGLMSKLSFDFNPDLKTVKLKNTSVVVNGDVYCIKGTKEGSSGGVEDDDGILFDYSSVREDGGKALFFVEVYKKEITKESVIRPYGNETSALSVDNYIISDKVGDLTSKRIQRCFRLRCARIDSALEVYAQGNNSSPTDIAYSISDDGSMTPAVGSALNTIEEIVYAIPLFSLEFSASGDVVSEKYNSYIHSDVVKYDYFVVEIPTSSWTGSDADGYDCSVEIDGFYSCEPIVRPYFSGLSIENKRATKQAFGCVDSISVSDTGIVLEAFDEKPESNFKIVMKCLRGDIMEEGGGS